MRTVEFSLVSKQLGNVLCTQNCFLLVLMVLFQLIAIF